MIGRRKNRNRNKRRFSKQNPTTSENKAKYDGEQNQERIPRDLTNDVLLRLPLKTLVKFRCVSKFWSSIIGSREFVNLFFARSSARPRLLTTFPDYDHPERRFFSSPHPQNPTEISSSVASHDLTVPGFTSTYVSKSLNGLVCAKIGSVLKICNPATKQFRTLPTPKTKTRVPSDYSLFVKNFFAYDPIDDQHKVLNTMIFKNRDENKMIMEHRVFLLGENAWRRIQSGPVHSAATDGLCINGVMYYGAWTDIDDLVGGSKIVAFNVKHENFKLINMPTGHDKFFFHQKLTLINFQEKLTAVDYQNLEELNIINVWVLEDESKGEWSRKSCVLPPSWRNFIDGTNSGDQQVADVNEVAADREFYLVGTINTGEIILAPQSLSERFSVTYYNMETNSLRRVEIDGMPNHKFPFGTGFGHSFSFLTFSDHIESIKFLDELDQY